MVRPIGKLMQLVDMDQPHKSEEDATLLPAIPDTNEFIADTSISTGNFQPKLENKEVKRIIELLESLSLPKSHLTPGKKKEVVFKSSEVIRFINEYKEVLEKIRSLQDTQDV